jgi:REP element-mobilizing transposase RayT
MAQSLSRVVIHLIFSTKNRTPTLDDQVRRELHPYLGSVLENAGCSTIAVGGAADHVHLLFGLSRTMAIAQVVEKVKVSSAKWLKSRWPRQFAWQGGYGVFSVGPHEIDAARAYVAAQAEHHHKASFQEELKSLLAEAGIEYDERYLWD